jgi:alkylation response protein AidB-like acyl-CoA dehydrogenase
VIDLAEDDDQSVIAQTARQVLADRAGDPAALWKECADLGWLGLALPEAAGGVGLGVAEQTGLFRELGRAVADGPFLATVLAADAALAIDDVARAADLAAGAARAALAEPVAPGRARWWADAEPADVLLLRSADGSLALIAASHLRVVDTQPGVDDSYRLVTADLDPAGVVLVPEDVAARLTGTARVLTAALLAGIAERTLELSVGYARDRTQYGKPIGAFQAVKHRCADMAVRAESAWAITALAAVGLAAGRPEAALDATAAWSVARAAALANARDNVQNHGAIGFTAEHVAHRYVKRAHVWAAQLGTRADARAELLAAPNPWEAGGTTACG